MSSTTSADGTTSERAAPGGALLSVHDLACRRGDRLLFQGLHFELHPGQLMWVRGPNGRGKTSLLRLLAGLARPETGRIEGRARPRSGASLYLAHANALKDDLSALEALQFLARLHGADAGATACETALRRFGLHGRRHAPVRTLSQGQRRRVALSRLLMQPSARLWILDEPFDALDADASAILNHTLAGHVRGGGAVVLTSHLDPSLDELSPVHFHFDENPLR
ncbi:MAG: cytochrome c biogenesis heme-transporting ATPase CcmA [Pseudomonadota bacterium]